MRLAIREGRGARTALAGVGAMLVIAAPAALGAHDTTTRLSTGPVGGNGAFTAAFAGASADGTRVFIRTGEQLTADDTDIQGDIYERTGATTTRLSTGPVGGNGVFAVNFAGASADGTRVFFATDEALTADDGDTVVDIYERTGTTTTRVSTGPEGGDDPVGATFAGASADGARVFIRTDEQLTADDMDSLQDIYVRAGGTTSRLSTGPLGGNGPANAGLVGASADGTRAFIETNEQLTADDTDSLFDIYERAGATTTRISTGLGGGNGAFDALFDGVSADGDRVFFDTDEVLAADDADTSTDTYERSNGTTTGISTEGDAAFDVEFAGASVDGGRVFFITDEQVTGDDLDATLDVYERAGTTTTRLSTGPAGGNGAFNAGFSHASADGTRVFLGTDEQLTADDTDAQRDFYERAGTTTTRITTGPLGGNGAFNGFLRGVSVDGTRAWIATDEQLTADDTDSQQDVYERAGDTTTRLSTGPAGGNGAVGATFAGASADGARALIETTEALTADDSDSFQDLYEASISTPPPPNAPDPPPTEKSPRTLALDASKGRVKRGKKVKLTGELSSIDGACESNQQVAVERQPKGKPWKQFATPTTDSAGSFSLEAKVKQTTKYRASAAETATCKEQLSNTEKVRAKGRKRR